MRQRQVVEWLAFGMRSRCGQLENAIAFYVDTFPDSKIRNIARSFHGHTPCFVASRDWRFVGRYFGLQVASVRATYFKMAHFKQDVDPCCSRSLNQHSLSRAC